MIRLWPEPLFSLRGRPRGFSLLELMITLLLLAIVTAIALPSFSNIIMRATLGSQARELMAGALMARSEAIKRNQVVTLCASSNGTSCTDDSWAAGWIVLAQNNQVVHKHKPLPEGFLINSELTRVTFGASGLGASMTSLIICRETPTVGSQERVVTISATGRPSISTTDNGECSPL